MTPATTLQKSSEATRLFERFSRFQTPTEQHRELKSAVAQWVGKVNVVKPAHWLTLTGRSGIGKTMLAKQAFAFFMRYSRFELGFDATQGRITGNVGLFVDWREFVNDVRDRAYGLLTDVRDADFVVLDDVATEHDPTGYVASLLDRVCNSRLRKWTLITCNLPFAEIAGRLDARIADRMLRDGSVVCESELESWQMRRQ